MSETKSNIATEPWRLEGALTIYTVTALRTQMMERLSQPGGLNLDLSAVDSCDCAGLQLLCSARKDAVVSGRHVRLENFSPAILAAAEGIGLDLESVKTTNAQVPV